MNIEKFIEALPQATMTVFAGVVVLALGQMTTKFLIDPIHELFSLRAEIAQALTEYANVGPALYDHYVANLKSITENGTPLTPTQEVVAERLKAIIQKDFQRQDDAKRHLRQMASRLLALVDKIPAYPVIAFLSTTLPKRSALLEAYKGLIALSNMTQVDIADNRGDLAKKVIRNLRMFTLAQQFGVDVSK